MTQPALGLGVVPFLTRDALPGGGDLTNHEIYASHWLHPFPPFATSDLLAPPTPTPTASRPGKKKVVGDLDQNFLSPTWPEQRNHVWENARCGVSVLLFSRMLCTSCFRLSLLFPTPNHTTLLESTLSLGRRSYLWLFPLSLWFPFF